MLDSRGIIISWRECKDEEWIAFLSLVVIVVVGVSTESVPDQLNSWRQYHQQNIDSSKNDAHGYHDSFPGLSLKTTKTQTDNYFTLFVKNSVLNQSLWHTFILLKKLIEPNTQTRSSSFKGWELDSQQEVEPSPVVTVLVCTLIVQSQDPLLDPMTHLLRLGEIQADQLQSHLLT